MTKLSPSVEMKRAMMDGDEKTVRRIVDKALGASFVTVNGTKAMHYAASFADGRWNHLIKEWADKDKTTALEYDKSRQTPLYHAIKAGNIEAVKIFLDAGAKPVLVSRGSPFTGRSDRQDNLINLVFSAKNNMMEMLDLFHERFPEFMDIPSLVQVASGPVHHYSVTTPIAAAALNGNADVVQKLIGFGCKPHLVSHTFIDNPVPPEESPPVFKNSALDCALRRNKTAVLGVIAEHFKTNPPAVFRIETEQGNLDSLAEAMAEGDNPNSKYRTVWQELTPNAFNLGEALIYHGVKYNAYKTIGTLLERGAPIPTDLMHNWANAPEERELISTSELIAKIDKSDEMRFLSIVCKHGAKITSDMIHSTVGTQSLRKTVALIKNGGSPDEKGWQRIGNVFGAADRDLIEAVFLQRKMATSPHVAKNRSGL